MEVIPAIDLLDGRVVRLHQGSYSSVTWYDRSPTDVARAFADAGVARIHVVDLNAARGERTNRGSINGDGGTIGAIRRAVACDLELGGGIRALEDVRFALDLGINRVVVGTSFAQSPDVVAEWCSRYPGRVVAAVDARDGRVQVSGWERSSGRDACEVAGKAEAVGIEAIQYTNIARDGTLSGPDIEGTERIAECASPVPVILSGGIESTDDIARVAASSRIAGVIVGRAIYEDRITIAAALEAAQKGAGR